MFAPFRESGFLPAPRGPATNSLKSCKGEPLFLRLLPGAMQTIEEMKIVDENQ